MKKFNDVFFCFFLTVFFASNIVVAQDNFCGTKFTKDQARIMNQVNGHSEGGVKPDYCLHKTLSIVAHIVLDSLDQPAMTLTQLDNAINVLNEDFLPICLSFQVCKIEYIKNYKYDRFHDTNEGGEAKAIYNVPRMINIFFVIDIQDPTVAGGGPAGGFAPMPPTQDSSDYIVIKKGSSLTGGKTMSHEMGHYFGLFHTWETSMGVETNNGSNCTTAGDLLCDTPPDAFPINFNGCSYSDNQTDPNGEFLTPIVGNIMSYHPATCKSPFTIMQLNRMAMMYLAFRTYLF